MPAGLIDHGGLAIEADLAFVLVVFLRGRIQFNLRLRPAQ
jgi:hypothetical protein